MSVIAATIIIHVLDKRLPGVLNATVSLVSKPYQICERVDTVVLVRVVNKVSCSMTTK